MRGKAMLTLLAAWIVIVSWLRNNGLPERRIESRLLESGAAAVLAAIQHLAVSLGCSPNLVIRAEAPVELVTSPSDSYSLPGDFHGL